jgi:hypothetical protein
VQLFDESGFEIYQTKTLVKEEEEHWKPARDIKAKLNTGKTLDANSLFRVKRAGNQLDKEERDRLFLACSRTFSLKLGTPALNYLLKSYLWLLQ